MAAEAVRGEATWGCVVSVQTGVLEVWAVDRLWRATLDGALLDQVARDRSRLPVAGEWVRLRWWPDGHVTVLGVVRPGGGAQVLPFPRR